MSKLYKSFKDLSQEEKRENYASNNTNLKVIVGDSPAHVKDMITRNKTVIIDVWAEWCHPCKAFKPTFEEIAGMFENIRFVSIDIENEAFNESEFTAHVTGVPTFLVYHNGIKVNEMAGGDKQAIISNCQKYSSQYTQSPYMAQHIRK